MLHKLVLATAVAALVFDPPGLRRSVAVYGGRPKRKKDPFEGEERLATAQWRIQEERQLAKRKAKAEGERRPPKMVVRKKEPAKKPAKKPTPIDVQPRLKRRLAYETLKPARFVGSYDDVTELPATHLPEVAFLGRSNVGKSSMLNALLAARKPVAVVGQRPGRTRRINLFEIADSRGVGCMLTDLPGYGYAKIGKQEQESIGTFVEGYLDKRAQLGVLVLIVDARRTAEEATEDAHIFEALKARGVPVVVVATKIDKFKAGSDLVERLHELNHAFQLPPEQPLFFSSVTRQGRNQLWTMINRYLMHGAPPPSDDHRRDDPDEAPPRVDGPCDESQLDDASDFLILQATADSLPTHVDSATAPVVTDDDDELFEFV